MSSSLRARLEDFIRHLATERGLSDKYQLNTRIYLEEFLDWLERSPTGHDVSALSYPLIVTWLEQRKDAGLGAGSMKLRIVAIKIFSRFLHARGHLDTDPAEPLALPRLDRTLPATLSGPVVEQLLRAIPDASDDPFDLRLRAMLELLYASGLRAAELCSARLENLDLENGVIRVTGKGNKTRLVPVGSQARAALERWLARGRPNFVKHRTGADIFLSVRGGRLTTHRLWVLVRESAARAGLDEALYPHLLRHSFATHLLQGGADLRVIQEMLGHADISTTEIYTHVDRTHLQKVHRNFHPRAK